VCAYGLGTRLQHQVVGVAEHKLWIELLILYGWFQALQHGIGAHRHEGGSLNAAVRRMQDAGTRPTVSGLMNKLEAKLLL